MRLSASRIRSINRRLARVQGFAWPAVVNRHPLVCPQTQAPISKNQSNIVKIVAVPRCTAA